MNSLYALIGISLLSLISTLHAGNFELDEENSLLAADAKASPPHSFTYTAKQFQTDIQIDPQKLEVSSATCTFQFADLDSKKEKRDKKMRGWMNVTHYPDARFELKSVRAGDTDNERIGVGQFTMHGVSREIEITFTIQRKGDRIIIDGNTTFDYTNWDLKIVRLFIFSVKPDLKPHFHLEGTLSNDSE